MNRSGNKKTLKMVAFIAIITLLATSFVGHAQTQERSQSQSVSINTTEDGKIKLKVVMKEGNDTKTFEKTYDSYDEINGDPDLEKNGIDLSGWNFGGGNSGFGSSLRPFRSGPSMFDFDMDNMRKYMESMMRGGFGTNNFFFNFDTDDPFFMNMDSLQNKLNFHFKNGKMFQNGDEIMDMDSIRDALKNRFGSMNFDFDFDNDSGNSSGWGFGSDNDDEGFHIISRARVFIRAAKDKDKEVVGADKMEPLEIKDISFYPNPSDGRFDLEIETTSRGPLQVKIVSPTGKVIYSKTDSSGESGFSFDIDISDEKEGLYILQVIQNNKTLTKRVIIE